MSVSFFTPVINQNNVNGVPTLGDYAERFFDFGQKCCIVSGIDGNTIGAREDIWYNRASMKEIALKIAVCVLSLFTVPLAMLIVKCVYRIKYAYVMEQEANWQDVPYIRALDPGAHQNANYQLQDVVDRIKQLATEGKKMCLILGRIDSEPLPQESDPNVCWVSLDLFSTGNIPPDRLHLWVSLNGDDSPGLDDVMPKLQGIFDKVVADWSSWKCCGTGGDDSAIDKCFRLLKPNNPNSELMFEESISCGSRAFSTEPECSETGYSLPYAERDNQQMHADCELEVRRIVRDKLDHLFDSHRLVTGTVYPYQYHFTPPRAFTYYHVVGTKPTAALDGLT